MSGILPRKYNNPIVIGLAVALIAAIAVIVLMKVNSSAPAEKYVTFAEPEQEVRDKPQVNETFIPTDKPTIVLYYADWCGWSKKILPTWENVKNDLESSGQFIVLDFEDNRDKSQIAEASKLPGFRGFPDIRLYPRGYPSNELPIAYTGDRSEESIVKFAYTGGKQV